MGAGGYAVGQGIASGQRGKERVYEANRLTAGQRPNALTINDIASDYSWLLPVSP